MRIQRCTAVAFIVLVIAALPVVAQSPVTAAAPAPAQAAQPASTPPARPADVASVDAIIAALYDVISGDAGQKRDWDRFRSLFVANARLIPTGKAPDGTRRHRVLTPDEYARNAGPALERDGFFERELGRKEERYGDIVQLMSAYDSKRKASDEKPFARGINSIQLWNDGTRWWVVTVFWESETPENPIPGSYFKKP